MPQPPPWVPLIGLSSSQNSRKHTYQFITKNITGAKGMTQVVERQPSKHEPEFKPQYHQKIYILHGCGGTVLA
jgi:hypothetical protein